MPTIFIQDILEVILTFLRHDSPSLRACSLVHRTATASCQRHLFNSIRISLYPHSRRLTKVFESSPHLATYVQRVSFDQTSCRGSSLWQPLLPSLFNTTSLTIHWGFHENPGWEVFEQITRVMPLLNTLVLWHVVFPSMLAFQQLVCALPELRTLDLKRCTYKRQLGEDIQAPTYVDLDQVAMSMRPRLQTLAFAGSGRGLFSGFPLPLMEWLLHTDTASSLRKLSIAERPLYMLATARSWLENFPTSLDRLCVKFDHNDLVALRHTFADVVLAHAHITRLEIDIAADEHGLALVLAVLRVIALPSLRHIVLRIVGEHLKEEYKPFPKPSHLRGAIDGLGLPPSPNLWRIPTHVVDNLETLKVLFVQVKYVHTGDMFRAVFSEAERNGVLSIVPHHVFKHDPPEEQGPWGTRVRGVARGQIAHWRG